MRVPEPISHGDRLRITLLLDTGLLEVFGTATRIEAGAADAFEVGVRFDDLTQEQQDIIVRWCFRRPFGPDYPLHGDESQLGLAAEPPVRTTRKGGTRDRRYSIGRRSASRATKV